jgi:O-glycosyl hydrolase
VPSTFEHVAFKTSAGPEGSRRVLVLVNDYSQRTVAVTVRDLRAGKQATITLPPDSFATAIWRK